MCDCPVCVPQDTYGRSLTEGDEVEINGRQSVVLAFRRCPFGSGNWYALLPGRTYGIQRPDWRNVNLLTRINTGEWM